MFDTMKKAGSTGIAALVLLVLTAFPVFSGQVVRDVPYGADRYQRMDIYLPDEAPHGGAPVIFFVHGGAWQFGDKTNASAIGNKSTHWTRQGYVFISANTRLLPDADPIEQAEDLADAIAFAQKNAARWNANPGLFVLMGHSAGAHLAALVSVDPEILAKRGGRKLVGTVSLDSGAYDITQIMTYRHHRLYDFVFGDRPDAWQEASPTDQVKRGAAPMLLVCSEFRPDSCGQARAFARKLQSVGTRAEVMPVRLTHGAINKRLGTRSDYTSDVDEFINSLELP
ncbi:alpha/beta hydrolase [Rhizobium sp. L1K21]|uniref:alpha/beta hydrolase n=1 Tax=Rhizobium sp. L1K21 TaxID=2954933 RepID=UPI0020923CF8|nr:alpha/beta hydrolase [Rhizobium sp. L1K21]MCO6186431.1 alpha/beta hydrolase [Rhizobium sp. L1K21]